MSEKRRLGTMRTETDLDPWAFICDGQRAFLKLDQLSRSFCPFVRSRAQNGAAPYYLAHF